MHEIVCVLYGSSKLKSIQAAIALAFVIYPLIGNWFDRYGEPKMIVL
jgi:hypothetical protein